MTIRDKTILLGRIWDIARHGYWHIKGDERRDPIESEENHKTIDDAIEQIRREIENYG